MQKVDEYDPSEPANATEIDRQSRTGPRQLTLSQSRLAELLVRNGSLNQAALKKISRLQKRKNLSFAQAAVRSGVVSRETMQNALARQLDYSCLLPGEGGLDSSLVAAYRPFDAHAEGFRSIRSQIVLYWASHQRLPLAIVSPRRGDGRSYVASNLAISFAQLGSRTLLIDANLRNPIQHRLFNLNNATGLGPLLAGFDHRSVPSRCQHIAGLYVLSAGPMLPNPQELVSAGGFELLLREANEHFDAVIIDTPASASSSDTLMIATQARSALVVACRHRTPIKDVQRLTKSLHQHGVDVIGGVLNTT